MTSPVSPRPEPKRIIVSSGTIQGTCTLPDEHNTDGNEENRKQQSDGDRISSLARSHPFIQQIDLVLQDSISSTELVGALTQSGGKYYKIRTGLAEFVVFATARVQGHALSLDSNLVAVAVPSQDAESLVDTAVWCLDTRGVLTIAVDADTYQRLGLVGRPLPWAGQTDTYTIHISLHHHTTETNDGSSHVLPLGPKVQAALEAWDVRRGLSSWDVVYCLSPGAEELEDQAEGYAVSTSVRPLRDIHVPWTTLPGRPEDADQGEAWNENVAELLEWVGLVCLGSQRLQASDRPDPWLAVYAPPSGSKVADVIHIRWTGLMAPEFVQRVIDTCKSHPFASISAHSVLCSPVAHISPASPEKFPARAPREDSEDTWTLILSNPDGEQGRWLLAESVGRWDSRWG